MNAKEVAKMLGINEERITKYKGVFRLHKSYFYRHGSSSDQLKDYVIGKIPSAEIVDYGDHWHDFVGGAKEGRNKDSFFWVKFKIV